VASKEEKFIFWFNEIGKNDVHLVGGKNANLGEMYNNLNAAEKTGSSEQKISVPFGFAISTAAYLHFIKANNLGQKIAEILQSLDTKNIKQLEEKSLKVRELILASPFPPDLEKEILEAFLELAKNLGVPAGVLGVAVRSSSPEEDLTESSFAGLYESYLNIRGNKELLINVKKVFASLFSARGISYRYDGGYNTAEPAISVTVQKMVRSDLGVSGIMFSLDTENGFSDLVLINASYGLGEVITKGEVTPDEYKILKSMIPKGPEAVIEKRLGSKEKKLVYGNNSAATKVVPVDEKERGSFALSEGQIMQLAKLALDIEQYFGMAVDVEWAYDGQVNKFFVVQVRPQTAETKRRNSASQEFVLLETGSVITEGLAVGKKVGAGNAHYIRELSRIGEFMAGEVLITDFADANWEPAIKIAAALVTNLGGRASHAAIIARELGIPAVVGTNDATVVIRDGQQITVSCAEGEMGKVYQGILKFRPKGKS